MCFVRSCNTGLSAMLIAEVLSQSNLIRVGIWKCNSVRRLKIHYTSYVAEARALYSDSVEERATTFCFLHFQERSELPSNTQNPETDRLVMGHVARSASQKTCRDSELLAERRRPCPEAFLRYLTNFKAEFQ